MTCKDVTYEDDVILNDREAVVKDRTYASTAVAVGGTLPTLALPVPVSVPAEL